MAASPARSSAPRRWPATSCKMCVEMGGSITGEHGVGMEKRDYLPRMFAPDDIDFMHRVRRAFDPHEIANPGKMFPGGEAPALTQTACTRWRRPA